MRDLHMDDFFRMPDDPEVPGNAIMMASTLMAAAKVRRQAGGPAGAVPPWLQARCSRAAVGLVLGPTV